MKQASKLPGEKKDEVEDMIKGLIRLEGARASVLVKFPDVWVTARK